MDSLPYRANLLSRLTADLFLQVLKDTRHKHAQLFFAQFENVTIIRYGEDFRIHFFLKTNAMQ